MESETLPFKYGWVFFYQSEEFVKNCNEDALVGGNAPILVDKYKGTAYLTGTSKDISFYIEEYVTKNW